MNIKSIELGLLNKCVLKCPMCLRQEPIGLELEKNVQIDFDHLVKFLDQLSSLEQVDLVGSVSEPTLYKEILELISYIKDRNLKIRLSTNGNTFTEKWWEDFGSLFDEHDIVRFAIDGSTQEIHSKYRVGGTLDKVLLHHRLFKNNTKAITVLQNILFQHNIEDQENIKRLFYEEPFDICEFTHTGNACYEEVPELITNNILPVPELLSRYQTINSLSFETNIACSSLNSSQIYLNHLGCVLPCDDMEEITFSNPSNITIYDNSFEECLEFVDSIISKRSFNATCIECCGSINKQIREDYPIIQYNRKGKRAVLYKFREIIDDY